MKAIKGILVYTGLILLAIVLILGLMVGFLFLSKNSNIFGYYFRNVSYEGYTHHEVDVENIRKVNLTIETKDYNIVVRAREDEAKISIKSQNQYFGFLKGTVDPVTEKKSAVTKPNLKVIKSEADSATEYTIVCSLENPQGLLAFKEQNTLFVDVPFCIHDNVIEYNLNLTTGNKNIRFETTTREGTGTRKTVPINVTGLKLTTNKGDAIISGIAKTVGDLPKALEMETLNISTNGGTFDFSSYDLITITDDLKLNSKNASYVFKNLDAKKGMEVVGTNVKFQADRVTCGTNGFLYKSDTGALNIGVLNSSNRVWTTDTSGSYYVKAVEGDKIYENTIFTESSAVEINEVVGKLGLKNTYGNVAIKHLTHQASITSENGDVKISKSGTWFNTKNAVEYSDKSSLIVYTTYGDIEVGVYYQDGVFYSKKGSITVNSKIGESEKKGSDRYYYTEITSKDGKITLITDGSPFRVVCTGDANVKLNINNMFDKVSYPSDLSAGLLPKVFAENIPYYISTNNGKIEASLPIQSYLAIVKGSKISGGIGATTSFDPNGTQISGYKNEQPKVAITGKNIVLKSNI